MQDFHLESNNATNAHLFLLLTESPIKSNTNNEIMNDKDPKPYSVNKISNLIVDGQLRDIKLLTKGHLNEAHLKQLPKESIKIQWESSNKPHILQRRGNFFKQDGVDDKKVDEMCQRLAAFSVGAASEKKHQKRKEHVHPTPYTAAKRDDEFKLPELVITNKEPSVHSAASSHKKSIATAKTLFETDIDEKGELSKPFLPKVAKTSSSLNTSFKFEIFEPMSDIEMAFKVIHDPLSGATKQEKLRNLKKFEQDFIQIGDLTNSNVLQDTAKIRFFENRLENVRYKI